MPREQAPPPRSAFPAATTAGSPGRFINQELSWLAFNERVLDEAHNPRVPLLERVRFLSISASNWDEFYMVRVAGLKGQVEARITTRAADGRTPAEQLAAVLARGADLVRSQQACWIGLRDELSRAGIVILRRAEIPPPDRTRLRRWYRERVLPLLTPMAVEPTTAFPFIPNLGFCVHLRLRRPNGSNLASLVPLPRPLPRFVRLPGESDRFVVLEDLIAEFVDLLYPSFRLLRDGSFRIIRDSEVIIDERAEDLVLTFESALRARERGEVIRLSVSGSSDPELHRMLAHELGVDANEVFQNEGLLGLADIRQLILPDRTDLLFPPHRPMLPASLRESGEDMLGAIRAADVLVHHPFETFDVVQRFLSQAARDPAVVAIKQTLYRTSPNSPIVSALTEAARAGKQVTAVVELKARFDEQANIRWARELEQAGARVVYGFLTFKIHAKMSLVVRQEGGRLVSYAHFGTGNYHPVTARVYTDLSLFTADRTLCRDAARVFNYLTGHDRPKRLSRLHLAPHDMRHSLLALIDAEIAHVGAGRPGTIWLKCNALIDPALIDALYRASEAGVSIEAIVRGMCALRPGVSGLSSRIRVTSVVGRFLEHSRIVAFGAGQALPSDDARVFISSADWMSRNMDRRIELLVPVESTALRQRLLGEIIEAYRHDTAQSWRLQADGTYRRPAARARLRSAHDELMAPS